MIQEINQNRYCVRKMDGASGMLLLPDKSIKLIYGSPPYPNAERAYGIWRSSEYIDKMTPFLDAACLKLRPDGFIVLNIKANREKATTKTSSRRSLIIEKLAIEMEENWGLYCVDIEIWIKEKGLLHFNQCSSPFFRFFGMQKTLSLWQMKGLV